MKDKNTQTWVPMYVDKWLFGSTRLELDPGERSVFVDLIMMGAKDNGYIRANETIAYPPKQLAAFLNISEELLLSTISKCLQHNKLDEVSKGMWRIRSWDNFQLSKSYKSELITGKKDIPGVQRTESSPQRTESSLIKEYNRVDKIREEEKREDMGRPTFQDVEDYCKETGKSISPKDFFSYYEAAGWVMGNTPIRNWKALADKWQSKDDFSRPPAPKMWEASKDEISGLVEKGFRFEHIIEGKCSFCGSKAHPVIGCDCHKYISGLKKAHEKSGVK